MYIIPVSGHSRENVDQVQYHLLASSYHSLRGYFWYKNVILVLCLIYEWAFGLFPLWQYNDATERINNHSFFFFLARW